MSEYGYIEHSELYHHGIKGQKWGIRRYQNEDGSYKSGAEGRYYHPIRNAIRGVHSLRRTLVDKTRSIRRNKMDKNKKDIIVGEKPDTASKKEKKVITQESELAAKRAKMRKAADITARTVAGLGMVGAAGLVAGKYMMKKSGYSGKDVVNRALRGLTSGKTAGQIGSNAISNIRKSKNINNAKAFLSNQVTSKNIKPTVAQLTGSIKGAKNAKAFISNQVVSKGTSNNRAMLVGNPNLTDYAKKRNKLVAKYAKKAYKQYKKSTK